MRLLVAGGGGYRFFPLSSARGLTLLFTYGQSGIKPNIGNGR